MRNRCADPSFGIKPQALAILHMLAGIDPIFADWDGKHYQVEIQTFPWYNGREAGVCLVMESGPYQKSNSLLYVAFGECRHSDRIFVEHWEAPEPLNCPTLEARDPKVSDETYAHRQTYAFGEIGKVTRYICGLMAKHYEQAKGGAS